MFFRKKKVVDFLGHIGTDIHSHLVPGVDDGVKSVAEAASFMTALRELGLKKFITTPHIMPELYPNSPDTIAAPFAEVQAAIVQQGLDVELHFAAEYYMDEHFSEILRAPLLKIAGNLVLVEMSFMSEPPQLPHWIFELQTAGYQPVLAHPERFGYFHQQPDALRNLKQRSVLFQVNLLSFTGYYGRQVQKAAWWLVEEKLVDFAGTDLHHARHLEHIRGIAENPKLVKMLMEYPFKNAGLIW